MEPRVIVVTGASRGLGRAIADAFTSRGHTVVICAPGGEGGDVLPCDIRMEDEVLALRDTALARHGHIDWWINNAGLALTGRPLADMPSADFDRMVDINLKGTMNCCRVAIAAMQAQGHGQVWNMLGAGWDGQPVAGMNGYATTKSALTFLTAALASELVGGPVAVGAISPGLVMTEGFFREHARVAPDERAAREAVVNIIGDHPETIADWIADSLEAGQANGAVLAWLTAERIADRRAMDPPRDILSRYR